MMNRVVRRTCKALGTATRHPVIAELKGRQQIAFEVLHPQVQIVKASPTVQVAVGATIAGLVLTGHWSAAVGLAGCWIGSKPLTHLAAGGVACVGEVDAVVAKAIARLQAIQAEPEGAPSND